MHAPSGASSGHTPPLELLDMAMDSTGAGTVVGDRASSPDRRRPIVRTVLLVAGLVSAAALMAWMAVRSPERAEAPSASVLRAPVEPPPPTAATPPAGIEGFAELYVSAYLTATGPGRQAAIARYYPAAPEMDSRTSFDRYVTRAVVVDVAAVGSDVWHLTIAAEVLTLDGARYVVDGTHFYMVAVAAPDDRPFAATSLPVRVAAPPAGEIPAVVTGTPVVDQSLQSLATGFVVAYSTGADEIQRYTTAAAGITAIDPAPFATVTIEDITAVQITGERLQIRIVGEAAPVTGGTIRIEYHVVVETEGGAWKVAALATGPLTAGQLAAAEDIAHSPRDD